MNIPSHNVIKFQDELGHFEIVGSDSAKVSALAFEKLDPKCGEVIDVMTPKELEFLIKHAQGNSEDFEQAHVLRAAYSVADSNNHLNAQTYAANGEAYTTLSMKKDGHFYRVVFSSKGDESSLVDGKQMTSDQKLDLFQQAQDVLGEKGMQKFGLVEHRNAVINQTRATILSNALHPMNYLSAECAVPVREG